MSRVDAVRMMLAWGACAAVACVVETEPQVLAPAPAEKPQAKVPVMPEVAKSALPVAPPPDSLRTCAVDADCVAVLRNGCCHDGLNEALNKASVDAYAASFTCKVEHPQCPMHLVLDRRVPGCDATTHACKLTDPPGAP